MRACAHAPARPSAHLPARKRHHPCRTAGHWFLLYEAMPAGVGGCLQLKSLDGKTPKVAARGVLVAAHVEARVQGFVASLNLGPARQLPRMWATSKAARALQLLRPSGLLAAVGTPQSASAQIGGAALEVIAKRLQMPSARTTDQLPSDQPGARPARPWRFGAAGRCRDGRWFCHMPPIARQPQRRRALLGARAEAAGPVQAP